MKTINKMLLLSLAASASLLLGACDRNEAVEPEADMSPMAADPAMTPEPMADGMPMDDAMPMDGAMPMDDTMSFAEMDKNGDGGIMQDELPSTAMLHMHFTVADADGDGKLTAAEVDKHRADMAMVPSN